MTKVWIDISYSSVRPDRCTTRARADQRHLPRQRWPAKAASQRHALP